MDKGKMRIWTITCMDVDADGNPIGHVKTITILGSLSKWLFNQNVRAHFIAQTNRRR